VVFFDNAGRTAQLRAAQRLGARVVFISARRRQRNKAFRLRWMRLIDEHWIAYPEFIAGELRLVERLKLKFMRRPEVRYLDVILARGRGLESPRISLVARLGCAADAYVLVVPGGGTGHPGANDAVERFLHAARELAAAGVDTLFVGPSGLASGVVGPPAAGSPATGSQAAGLPATGSPAAGSPAAGSPPTGSPAAGSPNNGSRLRMLGFLPQTELAELMRGARLIIANGGSTLLQSIACGRPCIAVPIAGDQAERIRRCVSAGVAVAAPLDSALILKTATDLLQNAANLSGLAGRAMALGLTDGVDRALRATAKLIDLE
jgi:hypothetical protein